MLYLLRDGVLEAWKDGGGNPPDGAKLVGACGMEESEEYFGRFGLRDKVLYHSLENPSARFESHESIDIICVPVWDFSKPREEQKTMHFYIGRDCFLVVTDDVPLAEKMFRKISNGMTELSFGKLLFCMFDGLLEGDNDALDGWEEKIIALENDVIKGKTKGDYVGRIIAFRKRLVRLRRHYEQLANIFRYIDANENGLFDRKSVKLLKILSGKIDRLHGNVTALIEYVAQIREAYQSEVDISLNTTMKVFTVVTTIFFPLTLIAGWYGMNFDMPEYHSAFGYPIVIAASVIIVLVSVAFLKKHNWF